MIQARRRTPDLHDRYTVFFDTNNAHVLGFVRNRTVLVLANFSENPQTLDIHWLSFYWPRPAQAIDLITGTQIDTEQPELTLEPYQCLWLVEG